MPNSVDDPSGLKRRTKRQVELVREHEVPEDREALVSWANELLVDDDRATSTVGNYLNAVRMTAQRAEKPLVSFESKEELTDLLESLQSGSHPDVKPDGINVRPYQIALTVFFGDHLDREWSADIKIGQPNSSPITDDSIIASDQADALLEATRSPRDSAIISFMLVSGQRKTAVLSIKVGGVELNDRSGEVRLNNDAVGLKGASGPRPLLWARPYIANWLENHPRRSDPEAPLFCCLQGGSRSSGDGGTTSWERGDPLSPDQLENRLNKIAKRAGVNRDLVKPHTFRHTAITRMRDQGVSDDRIRFMVGLAEDSDVLERYDQAEDEKMVDRVREHYGIETEDSEIGRPSVDNCPQCRTTIRDGVRFCPNCGGPVTMDATEQVETTRETIQDELVEIEDREKREFARDALDEAQSDSDLVDAVASEVMARLD